MAKTKRTKRYHPKPRQPFGGLVAISANVRRRELAEPLAAEQQLNVELAYHQSIDAMTGGHATQYHFDTIVYALNIGVILAERGLGSDYLDLLRPALAAMSRAKDRYLKLGKFGLDGDGLIAVRDVAGLHAEQIRLATQQELVDAIDTMHRVVAENKEAA